MRDSLCDRCYYGTRCAFQDGCAHFMELVSEADESDDEIAEYYRSDYHAAWNEYISEYDD